MFVASQYVCLQEQKYVFVFSFYVSLTLTFAGGVNWSAWRQDRQAMERRLDKERFKKERERSSGIERSVKKWKRHYTYECINIQLHTCLKSCSYLYEKKKGKKLLIYIYILEAISCYKYQMKGCDTLLIWTVIEYHRPILWGFHWLLNHPKGERDIVI